MTEKKYENLFAYKQEYVNAHPADTWNFTHMFNMNDNVVKGAFTAWAVWFAGPSPASQRYKPHVHDNADEIHGYFGSDQKDLFNLGGEIEIWIEDEQYLITKSCLLYIPRGIQHAPWSVNRVDDPDKPIFHFMTLNHPSPKSRTIDDPKWSHLPDVPVE